MPPLKKYTKNGHTTTVYKVMDITGLKWFAARARCIRWEKTKCLGEDYLYQPPHDIGARISNATWSQ